MSYFQDLPPEGKETLRAEFGNPNTSDERRVEILTLVRDGANEAEMGTRCPRCKNFTFYIPWGHALIEGHVYSHDGISELRITGYCEFCFDVITEKPEED